MLGGHGLGDLLPGGPLSGGLRSGGPLPGGPLPGGPGPAVWSMCRCSQPAAGNAR